MTELHAALAARVDSWRADGYPHERFPTIAEVFRFAIECEDPEVPSVDSVSELHQHTHRQDSYREGDDMPNVVGERFQITIDKKVREELGIQPGDQALEWVEDGRLVIAFMPRPHNESMLGILKRYRDKPIEPITDWEAEKERAWAARSAEIMEVLRADSERHRTTARSRKKP